MTVPLHWGPWPLYWAGEPILVDPDEWDRTEARLRRILDRLQRRHAVIESRQRLTDVVRRAWASFFPVADGSFIAAIPSRTRSTASDVMPVSLRLVTTRTLRSHRKGRRPHEPQPHEGRQAQEAPHPHRHRKNPSPHRTENQVTTAALDEYNDPALRDEIVRIVDALPGPERIRARRALELHQISIIGSVEDGIDGNELLVLVVSIVDDEGSQPIAKLDGGRFGFYWTQDGITYRCVN